MPRMPLINGAYSARSIIASAQRSVNLYAEKNAEGSVSPMTYYPAPGLTEIAGPTGSPGRGLYLANSDELYYVSGSTIYYVDKSFHLFPLYTILSSGGPVSMADNGTEILLVDGTSNGYFAQLGDHTSWGLITAAANAPPPAGGAVYGFYGGNKVDMIDGFFVLAQPNSRNFYTSYNNEAVFDSLYFAAKNGYSDDLVTLVVTKRYLYLLGERTSEIWIDAGLADFPFQINSGPFFQRGCSAPYSVAQINGSIFFLSQDQGGGTICVKITGTADEAITTQAIAYEWASYTTTADATGFCFQLDQHIYYQINFPTADKSWRWDDTIKEWAEVVYIDPDGTEHRHRVQQCVYAYGKNIGYDFVDGRLYAFDSSNATDNGREMVWRRGWPHIINDNKRMRFSAFTLDCDVGGVPNFPSDTPPLFQFRYSDTRGATWSNPILQSLGASGQYATSPTIKRLGMARDRVYECFGTIPGPEFAINGAFVDGKPSGS